MDRQRQKNRENSHLFLTRLDLIEDFLIYMLTYITQYHPSSLMAIHLIMEIIISLIIKEVKVVDQLDFLIIEWVIRCIIKYQFKDRHLVNKNHFLEMILIFYLLKCQMTILLYQKTILVNQKTIRLNYYYRYFNNIIVDSEEIILDSFFIKAIFVTVK